MKMTFCLCAAILSIVPQVAWPTEFRTLRPILTPAIVSTGQAVQTKAGVQPISRNLAKKAIDKIISAWNENHVDNVLGKEFFDKSRLNDAMSSKVPRDARLEVLAIQDLQTLQQHTIDSPSGQLLISTVTITVKTQLTFNDTVNGYQRREGVNEYLVRIKQRAATQ